MREAKVIVQLDEDRLRRVVAEAAEEWKANQVLTWHPVDATQSPVEIPLYQHVELPSGLGELRSHTREVPPPADETPEVSGA